MRKLILCLALCLCSLSASAGLFSLSHRDRIGAIVEAMLPAKLYQEIIVSLLVGAAQGHNELIENRVEVMQRNLPRQVELLHFALRKKLAELFTPSEISFIYQTLQDAVFARYQRNTFKVLARNGQTIGRHMALATYPTYQETYTELENSIFARLFPQSAARQNFARNRMIKHFYFESLRRKLSPEELAVVDRSEANPVFIKCRGIFDNARLGEWAHLWQVGAIPQQESSWGWHWGWRH